MEMNEDIKPIAVRKRRYIPRIALYCLTTGLLTLTWVYTSHLTVIAYASAMEKFEDIRASITERFREVQVVREYIPREQKPLAKIIKDAASRHGVSPLLLTALITQESGSQMRADRMRYEPHLQGRFKCPGWANEAECKAYATSWGLAQVVYGFWKDECGLQSYSDLLDPEINLNCGASIMGNCLKRNSKLGKVERYRVCLGLYNGDRTGKYANEVLAHLTNLIIEKEL